LQEFLCCQVVNMTKGFDSIDKLIGFYVKLGYTGYKLKKVLGKDKSYWRLIKERRAELRRLGLDQSEIKKYVLLTNKDVEILITCKRLEKINLTKEDRSLVKLIKTQLEEDWRTPLKIELNRLLRKYE